MSAIPLHDLDEVATKADIAMLRAEIKADIAGLRTELTTEIGSLQRSFTFWILTLIVAIIGAMSSIAFLS